MRLRLQTAQIRSVRSGRDGSTARPVGFQRHLLALGVAALLLLLSLFACREPQFVYTSGDGKHLQICRTFSIEPECNKKLLIWGMRPISCEAVKDQVAAQFRQKGFVQVPSKEADLSVIVSAFVGESETQPQSISLVVEVADRNTRQPLWSGQAELPWTDGPAGTPAMQPRLADFLKALPARIEATGPEATSPSAAAGMHS